MRLLHRDLSVGMQGRNDMWGWVKIVRIEPGRVVAKTIEGGHSRTTTPSIFAETTRFPRPPGDPYRSEQ